MGKSPIEGMLRNAICARADSENARLWDYCDTQIPPVKIDGGYLWFINLVHSPVGDPTGYGIDTDESERTWSLFSNVRVATYKVDLLLVGPYWLIAIECDGHDYHERTKQQAAYDRSRDRELLALGISTIRFTGSEIHHDADRCAADAFRCARVQSERERTAADESQKSYQQGWATALSFAAHEAAKAGSVAPEEHW
jgi:very-short-patch-repair endonuclease